jgi:hypothetical protein
MAELTADRVRELLHYDPATGKFTWKVCRGPKRAGDIAGWLSLRGYKYITLDGRDYSAHRLAWLYTHGSWPDGDLDHENRNKADTRIAKLRLATCSQNLANTLGRSPSGYKGVSWSKTESKFVASITVSRKLHRLGAFSCPKEAHASYCEAALKHFGEYACFAHRDDRA